MQIFCQLSKYILQRQQCVSALQTIMACASQNGDRSKQPDAGMQAYNRGDLGYGTYHHKITFRYHDAHASRSRNAARQIQRRASLVIRMIGHKCTCGCQQSQIMSDTMLSRIFSQYISVCDRRAK